MLSGIIATARRSLRSLSSSFFSALLRTLFVPRNTPRLAIGIDPVSAALQNAMEVFSRRKDKCATVRVEKLANAVNRVELKD
ncbi:hypothetical protein EXIGLDRAFT_721137 [Exidia glandulosa HHB12029]|uniref:Uncharacterized protein n=1 Tax=Exidia glandulosa HHB12029 TaxID=1314781 RepID=A0A165FWN9_EXIGL|nr:hypothetical protein EXIGLDRAFT_721137 [Exidia glandulosa HHB12029]